MSLPMLPQDKANHVAYGAAMAAATACLLALIGLVASLPASWRLTPLLIGLSALAVTVAAAAAKEWIYDAAHSDIHTVDPWDFAATVSGGVLVAVPILVLSFVRN